MGRREYIRPEMIFFFFPTETRDNIYEKKTKCISHVDLINMPW